MKVESSIFLGQVLSLSLHSLIQRDCPCFALQLCSFIGLRLSPYWLKFILEQMRMSP